jgi:tetratricopeptide (TPR) repeat protein
MTATATDPRPARSGRRQRILLAVFLLGGALLIAGVGRYAWRRYRAPTPPDIPLEQVDPALREAIEASRERIREDPYSPTAWGNLGRLLLDCRLIEPAVQAFDQAQRLDPADPRWPYLEGLALLRRNPDAALPSLRHAVELDEGGQQDGVAPRLRLAEVLLRAGLYDEAEDHLGKALEQEPDYPYAHLLVGFLAYAQGRFGESRTHLLRCRHSPYTRQKACAQLAVLSERQGDAAAAEKYSREARTLPPDAPFPDHLLAISEEARVGKPAQFTYLDYLVRERRYADAIVMARQMAEKEPYYRTYVLLGQCYAGLGQLPQAEEALRKAVALAPDNVQANYFLAKVLLTWAEGDRQRGGDKDRAEARFRAAAEHARKAVADTAGRRARLCRSGSLPEKPRAAFRSAGHPAAGGGVCSRASRLPPVLGRSPRGGRTDGRGAPGIGGGGAIKCPGRPEARRGPGSTRQGGQETPCP